MEISSFCILNEILFLCNSNLVTLLSFLSTKYDNIDQADQGQVFHTNPHDFLIICPPAVKVLVETILKRNLDGELHFKGADLSCNNLKIKRVEYVPIEQPIYVGVDLLQTYKLD